MNKIKAEGLEYIYFTGKERIPTSTWEGKLIAKEPSLVSYWDQITQSEMSDMRLIARAYPLKDEPYRLRFLHWDTNQNLVELDAKIINGTYTDVDFEDSLITVFGKTFCNDCDWEGLTLVFWTAELYMSAEVELAKIKRRAERDGFKRYPNCGRKLTQMVVKIFDL